MTGLSWLIVYVTDGVNEIQCTSKSTRRSSRGAGGGRKNWMRAINLLQEKIARPIALHEVDVST
jgi:hypothetical protein